MNITYMNTFTTRNQLFVHLKNKISAVQTAKSNLQNNSSFFSENQYGQILKPKLTNLRASRKLNNQANSEKQTSRYSAVFSKTLPILDIQPTDVKTVVVIKSDPRSLAKSNERTIELSTSVLISDQFTRNRAKNIINQELDRVISDLVQKQYKEHLTITDLQFNRKLRSKTSANSQSQTKLTTQKNKFPFRRPQRTTSSKQRKQNYFTITSLGTQQSIAKLKNLIVKKNTKYRRSCHSENSNRYIKSKTLESPFTRKSQN